MFFLDRETATLMFRKDLINLLLDNRLGLRDIAEILEVPIKDLEDDLRHLQKSLKRSEYRLNVKPAVCNKCGFKFDQGKLHKPSKCPICHHTWIHEPQLSITRKH
jgi:predicted Zn-ribbon and HTH transcriptional regulator